MTLAVFIGCGLCCEYFDPWVCAVFIAKGLGPLYVSGVIAIGAAVAWRRAAWRLS